MHDARLRRAHVGEFGDIGECFVDCQEHVAGLDRVEHEMAVQPVRELMPNLGSRFWDGSDINLREARWLLLV
ncbi:ribose-phosphate pyrophosphokinase, precursor [Mycolicibacterium brisbanense]|uniref:Ribose-phosphate pyrophosphokinase n=1 Tax=Mycolicibacterium brisbanense TaxID=146020 RepID=A0A117I4Z8_9MYCO|nr:ribose-phosphate pyrophosphokinase, precursor [Mycolicibacterium brisbanense]